MYASLEGVLLGVSDAFCTLTGYSRDELSDRKYQDITPREYHKGEAMIVQETLRTGEPAAYEKQFTRKDGSRVPVFLIALAVKGANDEPTGLAAIIKDVTESKLMEKDRDRLFRAVKKTREAVCVTLPDGVMIYANDAMDELIGCGKGELIWKLLTELVVERDAPRVGRAVKESFEKGHLGNFECTMVTRDKKEIPVEVSGTLVKDSLGSPTGLITLVRDITELKKLEDRLRKIEEQPSATFETARALTFSYDIATGEIAWGGFIEEITGYASEEFAKVDMKQWVDRMHPDDRHRILKILKEAQGKDRSTAEFRFRTKEGYATVASINFTEKQKGKAVRIVGILQDITEKRRSQKESFTSEKIAAVDQLTASVECDRKTAPEIISSFTMRKLKDEVARQN